jgi:hypothetical protein
MPNRPAQHTRPSCSPQYPCNRFVSCPRCAGRRQARYADIAERIAAAFGPLELAVITPDENTAAALRRAKNSAIRALTSPAAIWSIETGATEGRLHLNIIGPNLDLHPIRNAETHKAPLYKPARAAGAYITKPAGYPAPGQYDGRTVGCCGNVMQYLTEASQYPAIQAAAILQILHTGHFTLAPDQTPKRQDADSLHQLADQFAQQLENLDRRLYAARAI